jgi:hypothetical protein
MKKPSPEMILAARLARCYVWERRRYESIVAGRSSRYRLPPCYDGTAGGPEARGPSVWVKLARICKQRDIDGVHYIQWSLDLHRLALGRPPEPNQLLANALLDAYSDGLPKEMRRIPYLNSERCALKAAMAIPKLMGGTDVEALAYALGNLDISLSALFRYSIARLARYELFDKIAAHFEEDALYEYGRHPAAYDSMWGEVLPPDIATRSAKFYDELYS